MAELRVGNVAFSPNCKLINCLRFIVQQKDFLGWAKGLRARPFVLAVAMESRNRIQVEVFPFVRDPSVSIQASISRGALFNII